MLINTQLFLIFVIYLFGLIEWETQISKFTEFYEYKSYLSIPW